MSGVRHPADLITLSQFMADKSIASTEDNAKIQRYIRQASMLWTQWTGDRAFVPYLMTRKYGVSAVRGRELLLDDDLLEVVSITNADSAVVSGSAYNLRPDNHDVKTRIELTAASGGYWNFPYVDNRVQVNAWWGYHDNYAAAWGDSFDTVENNPLAADGTSITVNDADGIDDEGNTRFVVGTYLMIEDEMLQVLTVNTVTNVLTVRRGIHGTTAAAHTQNTSIATWRLLPDVQFGVGEIAKWIYEHRDKVDSGVQLAPELGVVIVRELPEVKALAEQYYRRRQRVLSV